MENNGKGVWEYLRIATPVLTTLGLFIIGLVGSSLSTQMTGMKTELVAKIDKLDDKLFRHLTNDEMHAPRSIVVDKGQFELINQIRSEQMAEMRLRVDCIAEDLSNLKQEVRTNGQR